MNYIRRYIAVLVCFCMLVPANGLSAHSGRTDSMGGHHDYQNVSGLGSYHYHCGGHPAHLHENGVCPYDSSSQVSSSTTKKVSKYYCVATVKKFRRS